MIGVVGIGQDITARLAQEKEYSKLIDNANAPIFGVDTQGRVNVWNRCARKIVAYTLEEVMGQNLVEEFITKEYKYAVSTVLEKALRGEETGVFMCDYSFMTSHLLPQSLSTFLLHPLSYQCLSIQPTLSSH